MDLQAHKDSLLQQIRSVQDASIIQTLENILHQLMKADKPASSNWWNELTEEQQASAMRGLEQSRNGETISHEDMRREIDDLLRD